MVILNLPEVCGHLSLGQWPEGDPDFAAIRWILRLCLSEIAPRFKHQQSDSHECNIGAFYGLFNNPN